MKLITKSLGETFRLPILFPVALAQCHSDSFEFLLIPQDASASGRQVGAGGGDGEDAGLFCDEFGWLDAECEDVQCFDVGGGDDGHRDVQVVCGGLDAGFVCFQRDGADTFKRERV